MKKVVCIILMCLIVSAVFCGAMISTVSADENYVDHSNEYSSGDGAPPEDGMAREEPRTRFKDA